MVMICYLDDSDAEQSSVATIAGYVTTVDNWKRLELHLNAVCDQYGVKLLHAKEFHDTKGDFKGWSLTRKTQFIDDLYLQSQWIAFGISQSCSKNWKGKKASFKNFDSTSLYGLIFSSIVMTVAYNNPWSELCRQMGVSFLVENGHNNNDEIEQYFSKIKSFKNYKDILKSIGFVSKDSCRAIQLADFLAFHSRRSADNLAKYGNGGVDRTPVLKRIHSKLMHLETVVGDLSDMRRIGQMDEVIERLQWGECL